jgi:hypothetical protein
MASYRIVSQADATFGVETREPDRDPIIAATFKTETEARTYIEAVSSDRDYQAIKEA